MAEVGRRTIEGASDKPGSFTRQDQPYLEKAEYEMLSLAVSVIE